MARICICGFPEAHPWHEDKSLRRYHEFQPRPEEDCPRDCKINHVHKVGIYVRIPK